MAPAAQYQEQQSEQRHEDAHFASCSSNTDLSTTTRYVTSTLMLTLPAPGLSTSMRFITSIVTVTRTLPASTDPISTFEWPTMASSPTVGRFPIPQIQGLIPGLRRALHLNSSSLSLSPTPSHDQALKERILRRIVETPSPSILTQTDYTIVTVTPSPSPRRSAFPRVSPPGFLYPEKLVPKSEYVAQQELLIHQPGSIHRNASPYQPGIMGRVDYELAYLPTGVKLLFMGTLTVLVLAVIWVVLVWLINFPPGSWRIFKSKSGEKGAEKKEERRPIDKPSKYAPGSKRETEVDIVSSTSGNEDDSATTSALPAQPFSHLQNNEGEGIEMRQRPRHHARSYHRRQQSQLTQTERPNENFTEHRRTSSSPVAGLRFSYTPTPTHLYPAPTISAPPSPTASTLSSPPNPFLNPPKNGLLAPSNGLVKRSSTEWKRDHAAFFASPPHTPRSTSPAPSYHSSSDNVPASHSLETEDIEALEAGTRSPSSSGPGSHSSKEESPNGGIMRKSLSWIDQGLELVDGAVDGFVARVGRWTDDDGGDEALLLPVARRGMVGGNGE